MIPVTPANSDVAAQTEPAAQSTLSKDPIAPPNDEHGRFSQDFPDHIYLGQSGDGWFDFYLHPGNKGDSMPPTLRASFHGRLGCYTASVSHVASLSKSDTLKTDDPLRQAYRLAYARGLLG